MTPRRTAFVAMVALAVMPGAGASQESYADSLADVRRGHLTLGTFLGACPPNEDRMRDVLSGPVTAYQQVFFPGNLARFLKGDCFSPRAEAWLLAEIEVAVRSSGGWGPMVPVLTAGDGDYEPFVARLVADSGIPLERRIALADAFIGGEASRGHDLYFRLLGEDSAEDHPGPGGPPYGPIRNPLGEFLALRARHFASQAPGPFVPRMMESPLRNQYMGSMLMGLGPSTAEGAAAARSQVERVLTEEIMDLRARASREDASVELSIRVREGWIARLREGGSLRDR